MAFSSRFSKGIWDMHKTVSVHPFLERYKTKNITVLDHYRHLTQLLVIYNTLENLIKSPEFSIKLPELLAKELLNRSEELKKDLAFMKERLPTKYREEPALCTTMQYAERIHAEAKTADGDKKVFGHFLVRIIGDFFGGQTIKKRMAFLFLNVLGETRPGLNFYNFSKDRNPQEIYDWLNKKEEDNEEMILTAQEAFVCHEDIFDELEKTRVHMDKVVRKSCCAQLFTLKNAVIVAATTLTAVTTMYSALSS